MVLIVASPPNEETILLGSTTNTLPKQHLTKEIVFRYLLMPSYVQVECVLSRRVLLGWKQAQGHSHTLALQELSCTSYRHIQDDHGAKMVLWKLVSFIRKACTDGQRGILNQSGALKNRIHRSRVTRHDP
jgi:hypothetical protein